MSNGNPCGCGPSPVQPGEQMIVPPGTHIVQQPCAAVPQQSVAIAGTPFGMTSGGNNPDGPCSAFNLPVVSRSFVVAGTGMTGSFFSECAGRWGLPGMIVYFPSMGQLEILGTSQNTVTYRNLTMAPGTEILQGVSFAVGIPMPPAETVDTGGGDTGGVGSTEPVYEEASQMSNLRGVLNNVPSRISPVSNHVLVGRQGYWQRRPLGQMRFPQYGVMLNIDQAAATYQLTAPLPSKPVLPHEVSGFSVELYTHLAVTRSGSGTTLNMRLLVGGNPVLNANSEGRRDQNTTLYIHDLPKDATSLVLKIEKINEQPGNMHAYVQLRAYHY